MKVKAIEEQCSLEECEIRPYLKDIINNLKRSDIWKN